MRKYETDLTEGSVIKKMLLFVIPIFLSGVLQQLYNAADTMTIGQFAGSDSLAAVGATTALTNLILNLFMGLAVGANVLCAKRYGAQDKDGLSRAIHTALPLSFICGVVILIVGVSACRYMLEAMGTPDDVIDKSVLYMRIFFLGAPASLVYNFGAGILRAAGDTKRPLYILVCSGLVNVGLNLFCVIVLKLDVAGVAIGTIVSQFISAVTIVIILMRSKSDFRFDFKKIKLHKAELLEIAKVGFPAGLNGIMFNISNVVLQSTINSFGKIVIAGNTASSNIEVFFFLVLSSFEQGAVSFTGQNIGAKKYNRLKPIMLSGLLVAFIGSVIMSVAVYPLQSELLSIFTKDPDVIAVGCVKLTIVCFTYFTFVPNQVCGGCLRGMGKSITPTILNALFTCVARIIWVYTAFRFKPDLQTLFLAYPVSWVLSSVSILLACIIERKLLIKKSKTQEALAPATSDPDVASA